MTELQVLGGTLEHLLLQIALGVPGALQPSLGVQGLLSQVLSQGQSVALALLVQVRLPS